MNLIIRNARIIEKNHPLNQEITDIQISHGKIEKIGKNLPILNDYEVITFPDLHISKGWIDTSVSLGEPGFEDCETISNGLQVASKSGFTAVLLQPNSFPILDNQSQIFFVKQKANQNATDLYPIGALTKNSNGNELAELLDMKNAGAIAFGDYNKSLDNANILKIALQYTQDFNGKVIAYSMDHNIKGKGIVNEGIISTQLGLKGIPSLAEELIIARNLYILEYTGGKLHIPTLSTAHSVELIRQAKAKGLQISCSVAVHNLTLNDEVLTSFDSNYRVTPPIRTEEDRKALINGILDNTIDCITTDHNPIDIEHKNLEFDLAKNGTIGLESGYGILQNILPIEVIIEKLTAGRKIFNIEEPSIKEGEIANLTLFSPTENSFFLKENILSKSKNSAFINLPTKGKVFGIINNYQFIKNQ
ncbi:MULTISPECIES: dihydroorotase [Flavobacterium]|uniref:Dihydroorotase n=2 Tax=Flavobacterium TaxID=237 RepID=A0AA94JPT3_9FLAO|nr:MULTISPECIES: dihydroorotase [Flavobacterium]OXA76525.1 dihydroorotase [Flavobacterium columnare] [Flavobacterium columnare NBRC 100251 = ATCC 23463]AMA50691.1 dihydroorotase [Flavobacterium covae]AND65558.1 dihydroorotase [Flavobacterium covae]MCH4828991.1 dihydroorotase [Flavobacterium columnare]MCH4833764.1 dihydroorotase [Flavobacterium columnare]